MGKFHLLFGRFFSILALKQPLRLFFFLIVLQNLFVQPITTCATLLQHIDIEDLVKNFAKYYNLLLKYAYLCGSLGY